MSTSSNVSQSTYSPSEPETPQGTTQSRIQNFDQSLNHVDLGLSIEQSVKSAQKEAHQKRIQAMRKELDFIKSTEWEFDHDKDDDDEKEDFLAEQLLDLEVSEQKQYDTANTPSTEIPRTALCFQRTGIITYIDDNHILIDGTLYFDLASCSLNLNVNDKILYLGYKDVNESIVIVRILENYGLYWGDENAEENVEENSFNVREHVIIGEVGHREERFVYMKDDNLKFNLDDVEATFVPVKGDWLELKCNMQWDEEKPSDMTSAQVLKVISFKPLRSKVKSAMITEWFGDSGTCDRQIVFNRHCIHDGSVPKVGSKVMVEAIESNQGACPWRAIKMITIENSDTKSGHIIMPNREETSLTLEHERHIKITYPLKFDKVNFNGTASLSLKITNNSDQIHVINKWIILSKKRDSQVNISPVLAQPKKIYPRETFCFKITCCPNFLGSAKEHMIIMFRGFQVDRFIEVNVVNDISNFKTTFSKVQSESEKIDRMKKLRRDKDEKTFLPGVKPIKPPAFIPVKLGLFPIPEKIWSTVLGDSEQTVYCSEYDKILTRIETNLPCLSQDLNISNYIDRWHALLYIEEIQANISIRVYDMPKVFLIRCQEYLGVEVSGLSERRPSLIKGDRVIVKDIWDGNAPQYEGYIHAIKGDIVLIKFHQQFHETYSGSDVSIEFHFNRAIYRRSHQAINLALSNLGPDILFPSRIMSRPQSLAPEKLNSIQWFNKKLNSGQKAAVLNILLGECRPLPYCIYGPPGTGKTVTVIETILQILTLLPDSRILVATPSNSASNLITERLIQYRDVFPESIIRLIANHLLDSDNIPDGIKPFCATLDLARENTAKSKHVVKEGINLNCQTSFIGRHRVTIGTCYCLGTLAQMGLPRGHFTHIIVDEAGQATEPEIMIPMTFTDKENGQIILAGDPMQLGPVIMSKYCKEFGMDESYLSRVLESFPYQKDYAAFQNGFNNKLVTKLNDNYRSLQEVLTLPSAMFYEGSLIANIDRTQSWITKLLNVVSETFHSDNSNAGGIYVYGIRGCNARAEDSPSWYNPQEAAMVTLTACKLFKKNVTTDDVGIITPYIAQIKYLRLLFDAMGLPQPKIGTVEEFQGQERPIVILSTVRSTESHLIEDQRSALGFVKNPKRLNVAITRAQLAVILLCDPHLLSKDPLWQSIINHAVKEDKYMGCDVPYVCAQDSYIEQ